MNVVTATDLTKFYNLNRALDNFSISIPKGSIFALLGPNGAGKTTFIKCLLDLVRFSSGSLLVNDENAKSHLSRKGISYLPERFSFHPYYKAEAVMQFYAKVKEIPKNEVKEKKDDALLQVSMKDIS